MVIYWVLWVSIIVGIVLMSAVYSIGFWGIIPIATVRLFGAVTSLGLGPASFLGTMILLHTDTEIAITRRRKLTLMLFSLTLFCISTGVVIIYTLMMFHAAPT